MNLQNKEWSFSSVSCYNSCPYSFYLKYIENQTDHDNAFSQSGKLVHSLLERWANKELYSFELADKFEEEWDKVVTEWFPFPNIRKGTYNKCLEYLKTFDGFGDVEIIGVEKQFHTTIEGYKFVGYADLILRDENGIILVDHKSHKAYSSKEKEKAVQQLYLYAYCIKEEYGEYPYKMVFNHFKDGKLSEEIFDEDKLNLAVTTFMYDIDEILLKPIDSEWECNVNDWVCNNLCGMYSCMWNKHYEE